MTDAGTGTGDPRQHFIFEELDIRGVLVQLRDSWEPVRTAHAYPAPVERLLGELLTATALLASIIKMRGTLTVQASGDGPVAAIMAECRNYTELRAIARLRDPDAIPASSDRRMAQSTELLGRGLITITIRPEGGEPYQGIVPLDGMTLATALEGYFAQSEQIPTRLWLSSGDTRTGGLLLQALPPEQARRQQSSAEREEDFNRVSMLADTVTDPELQTLPGEQLLTRLFFEEQVTLQPPETLQFVCSCSEDRTREALRAMPEAELHDILREEGRIEMTCQFCHTVYRFDEIDVALVHQPQVPPPEGPAH